MKYTLYIDESGDAGITKIRTATTGGSSQFMTLGAALVPNSLQEKVRLDLQIIASLFQRQSLHCNRLNHNQIVRYAQDVSLHKLLLFSVASFKPTLGDYSKGIDHNHQRYYHKCLQYLFERVGFAALELGIAADDISIVIEEGVAEIAPLKKFISMCILNPIDRRARNLSGIDPYLIATKPKLEEPLLQLPDLVSHAVYRCLEQNESNFRVLETRYLYELRKRFFHNSKNDKIFEYGLKAIHGLKAMKLPEDVRKFLVNLQAN